MADFCGLRRTDPLWPRKAALGWRVDTTVCCHDTTRSKPRPDPILKALENLGIAPEDVIAIGDATGDILSAKSDLNGEMQQLNSPRWAPFAPSADLTP